MLECAQSIRPRTRSSLRQTTGFVESKRLQLCYRPRRRGSSVLRRVVHHLELLRRGLPKDRGDRGQTGREEGPVANPVVV